MVPQVTACWVPRATTMLFTNVAKAGKPVTYIPDVRSKALLPAIVLSAIVTLVPCVTDTYSPAPLPPSREVLFTMMFWTTLAPL